MAAEKSNLIIQKVAFVLFHSVLKSLELPRPHSTESVYLLFHIIRSGAKSGVVLFPLLGITWLFGILALDTKTIVFQYFFAILNSLQGFFIFIFHCLLNSEVRKYKGSFL